MATLPYDMATLPYMKMTMHIDDELLDRVVRLTGADSRTEAVDMALREMDRRSRLAEFGRTGLGLTPAELMESVIPGYDILEIRDREVADANRGRLHEDPPPVSRPMTYREFARSRRKSQG
jgi:hypothetical protein